MKIGVQDVKQIGSFWSLILREDNEHLM